eukprot:20873_6
MTRCSGCKRPSRTSRTSAHPSPTSTPPAPRPRRTTALTSFQLSSSFLARRPRTSRSRSRWQRCRARCSSTPKSTRPSFPTRRPSSSSCSRTRRSARLQTRAPTRTA